MRQKIDLLSGWQFTGLDGQTVTVSIPHTWNNIDGQDGGNDYNRGVGLVENATGNLASAAVIGDRSLTASVGSGLAGAETSEAMQEVELLRQILSAIRKGGDVIIDGNALVGYINRGLGALA